MSSLVAVVSGFASGIFFRSLFIFGWEPVAFILLLSALLCTAAFLKPRFAYAFGAMFFIFVALGVMRVSIAKSPLPDSFARDLQRRATYQGIVVADPDIRDANQRVQVKVVENGEEVKMLAVAKRHPTVAVGDSVSVSGTLEIPKPFADDGGRVFRYDKYLERDGVRFILNFAYLRVEEEASRYSVPAIFARIKHSFLDGLSASLPEPHASLAGGIIIGGKSGLGNDLKEDFIRSGLVHIIVLSGYNIMIVAEIIIAALALTKLPRRWGAIVGAFVLLIFVGIAGGGVAATRAALMALIALYARATGRSYAASRALLFVILVMLIWNPLYLVFDPGFGLSVAATAGLIWLAPIIEAYLAKRYFQKQATSFWRDAVATTVAAQIFVLPLLLYTTGNLSLVAFPANLLVAPIVPITMGLSVLAGFSGIIFGSIAPILGIIIGFPAYLANSYLIFIAQESADLPAAAFTLPPFPFWLVIVAYAALIYMVASNRFSTTPQLRLEKNASI